MVDALHIRVDHIQFTQAPLTDPEWKQLRSIVRNRVLEIGTANALETVDRKFKATGESPHIIMFRIPPLLKEPEAMLTHAPRIPGTDGRKMSKSYGNFISLSESDDSIRAKSRTMMTDPARRLRTDPGNP